MPRDICKLCQKEKDLFKSHLMPAALYALCDAPDSRPVRVAADVVMQTSRQVQDYLLCAACEDALNKGGESWLFGEAGTYGRGIRIV